MRNKLPRMTLLIGFAVLMILSGLLAAANPLAVRQGSSSDDQKYAGTWVGSYSTDNGNTDKLSYILSKDEKGQWRGTVRFTNQDGEQTAEFKSLRIADGKMNGKIESPDGQVEVTIEGQFREGQLVGTYFVSPKGSTDIVEHGTWRVTKSSAPKTAG